tara:strand:+ start:17080 stop:17253 length:174 start_codon:yes stop_codon:yes gene_type:complete
MIDKIAKMGSNMLDFIDDDALNVLTRVIMFFSKVFAFTVYSSITTFMIIQIIEAWKR